MKKISNKTLLRAAKAWQEAGIVHPMTCTEHGDTELTPVEENGKVFMKCPKCDWTCPIPSTIIRAYKQGSLKIFSKNLKKRGFL